MQQLEASIAVKAQNTLGEGPVWDADENQLYWIDIKSKKIFRFHPLTGEHRDWTLDQMVGCIALRNPGELICALQDKIIVLDTITGDTRDIASLEASLPDNRSNDGKPDTEGRFWVGTLHIPGEKGNAALYMIDGEKAPQQKVEKLGLSNGLGWSPDNTKMYLVDTLENHIMQFDFSVDNGEISNRKIILTFDGDNGSPDGLCVDAEGMLWVAFYGGKRVGRFDPGTGQQLAEVKVPAVNVTCCVFGGPDLDTLYITTARDGVEETELKEYPLTGSVFMVQPGVKGLVGNKMKN